MTPAAKSHLRYSCRWLFLLPKGRNLKYYLTFVSPGDRMMPAKYHNLLTIKEVNSMETVAIPQITERLQKLPTDKLTVVYDFVSYLLERETAQTSPGRFSEAFQTMLASEAVLRRDWDRPEEDEAWSHLHQVQSS